MSSAGEWGDHLTLQAAADAFNVRICVVSSFLENCIISIDSAKHQQEADQLQQQQEQQQAQLSPGRVYDERTLWLAFWAEVRCAAAVLRCCPGAQCVAVKHGLKLHVLETRVSCCFLVVAARSSHTAASFVASPLASAVVPVASRRIAGTRSAEPALCW
jgi:hypothetical protein